MRVNAILRLSAVFAACVVIGVPAVAQRIIRLGDAAPPLKLGLIVQGKMDHYPQQGRAMLIEFWAVSCSPCVAAVPHLNELVERFRDQPIDFVSIDVFEDANTVKKFLGAHRMEGVVALDGDPGTAPDYGLTATPVTVLIGRDGHVVAFTHPSQLNTVVVEQLLSGQPVRLAPFGAAGLTAAVPVQHSYFLQDPIGTRDRSLVNVVVVPTAEEGSSVDGPNQFESTGVDLVSLLSFAYDISPSQIDLPELLAHELYKVQAWVPWDTREELRPLLRAAIGAAAGIETNVQRREMEAIRVEGLPGKLTPAPERTTLTSTCNASGEMSSDGASLAVLLSCIEQMERKPVVEKPAKGAFRYSLQWNAAEPGAFELALRERLGIKLKATREKFDVLIVRPLAMASQAAKARK